MKAPRGQKRSRRQLNMNLSQGRYIMSKENPFQVKFFMPDARLLSENEIERLSAEKAKSAGADEQSGLWLELTCPDRSCLDA